VGVLEDRFANYCGTRTAVACASGSDALLLPLMALAFGRGDRVITTPFTFFATAGSIAHVGATPVFVDIRPANVQHGSGCVGTLSRSCTPADLRTIKAIIPVHLLACAEMEEIKILAGSFGIPVIEDAAQAIGAEHEGVRAGALGLCGAFSFFPSKNLGGFGDGGIITTNDEALAEKLRLLRVHGSGATYYHKYVGISIRAWIHCRRPFCWLKLQYLDEWTASRRSHAAIYRKQLGGIPAETVQLPLERPNLRHVYNQFTIRVRNRDEVRKRLAQAGVASAVYYPLPLHLQECFANLGYTKGDFPESEAASHEVLSLPVEQSLSEDEAVIVAERLSSVLMSLD